MSALAPAPDPNPPPRGEHLEYLLTAYLFNSLSAAGRAEVETHLAACAKCREELETLRASLYETESAFASDTTTYAIDEIRRQRIRKAAREAGSGTFFKPWKYVRVAAVLMVMGVGYLFWKTMGAPKSDGMHAYGAKKSDKRYADSVKSEMRAQAEIGAPSATYGYDEKKSEEKKDASKSDRGPRPEEPVWIVTGGDESPTSTLSSGVVVPRHVLEKAELGDHFETKNFDRPDTASAFGNDDGKKFNKAIEKADEAGGGGGAGGREGDVEFKWANKEEASISYNDAKPAARAPARPAAPPPSPPSFVGMTTPTQPPGIALPSVPASVSGPQPAPAEKSIAVTKRVDPLRAPSDYGLHPAGGGPGVAHKEKKPAGERDPFADERDEEVSKVSIASKDESIRRQEQQIVQAEAERARIGAMNEQLAKQNDEMAGRSAEAARRNAQETELLRGSVKALEGGVKYEEQFKLSLKKSDDNSDELKKRLVDLRSAIVRQQAAVVVDKNAASDMPAERFKYTSEDAEKRSGEALSSDFQSGLRNQNAYADHNGDAPFPGFVSGTDTVAGGLLTEVGSISGQNSPAEGRGNTKTRDKVIINQVQPAQPDGPRLATEFDGKDPQSAQRFPIPHPPADAMNDLDGSKSEPLGIKKGWHSQAFGSPVLGHQGMSKQILDLAEKNVLPGQEVVTTRVATRPQSNTYESYPAQYETVTREVLVSPGSADGTVAPVYKTVAEQVQIAPATKRPIPAPAEYKEVTEVVGGSPEAIAAGFSSLETALRAYRHFRAENAGLSLDAVGSRCAPVPPAPLTDDGIDEDAFIQKHGLRPFVDAARDPLSTFSMDVDTASYTRARALLREGKLPPPESVRVEEFVNTFKQPYSVPAPDTFGVFAEAAPAPFGANQNLELLKIGIKSRDPRPDERKPAVLTFVVDTSGSMARGEQQGSGFGVQGSGERAATAVPRTPNPEPRTPPSAQPSAQPRLALVKHALKALVKQLDASDAVTIVAFGETAELALPRTSARQKQRILDAIEALAPSGATNVEAGLSLGYRMADESFAPDAVNRVILCSDGVATVGAKGPDEILSAVKVFAARGIDLETVGFGAGAYNDTMMERLANNGNGRSHFVDGPETAEKVFREQIPAHLSVLARDAKVQVDFNPQVVRRYRLLGYENRAIADKDFRNDAIDAGEVGHATLVTALYELERVPQSHGALGKVFLRWKDAGFRHRPVVERNYPLPEGIVAADLERAAPELRFIACVAEFAELLRGNRWARDGSFAAVLSQLRHLPPEFRKRPEVKEVEELVATAQRLSVTHWAKEAAAGMRRSP